MNSDIRIKLSVMMFLEFLIWGAWLPLINPYLTDANQLGFSGIQAAWVLNTFAIASLVGMFIGGQLADRFLAKEKYLAASHFIGGVTMLMLPFTKTFASFFAIMLVHCLAYVPTISLTNAIAFANLKDAQKDFGPVRLWGTIGWIAASVPLFYLLEDKSDYVYIFWVAGIASLALAGYSLTLPHTPPTPNPEANNAPLEALRLLRIPFIAVLFVVTFVDALIHQCYFFFTAAYLEYLGVLEKWIMPAMSIGQIAEIATMACLGLVLKSLGWRTTMILGILGHALRFFVYAISDASMTWLVIGINVVHGACYAFFFATVYIFVDEQFPKDGRTSAQSLFNLMILGVGPFLGNVLGGFLLEYFKTTLSVDGVAKEVTNYSQLFLVPAGLAILAAAILFVGFHPPKNRVASEMTP